MGGEEAEVRRPEPAVVGAAGGGGGSSGEGART
jgi:hypothetical protein